MVLSRANPMSGERFRTGRSRVSEDYGSTIHEFMERAARDFGMALMKLPSIRSLPSAMRP